MKLTNAEKNVLYALRYYDCAPVGVFNMSRSTAYAAVGQLLEKKLIRKWGSFRMGERGAERTKYKLTVKGRKVAAGLDA